jgi:hypothetical protein
MKKCALTFALVTVVAAVLVPSRPADALASFNVSPTSIQFGKQFYGAGESRTVTVTNSGDEPMTVSDIVFGGDGADDYYAQTDCFAEDVEPGGTCEIDVYFVPRDSGTKFAQMTIVHDGQQTCPCDPVNLSGTVVIGYYAATSGGSITGLGAARTDLGGLTQPLNRPIVGMASTWTGKGVWLVAGDGGIFSFGDARFHGSTGAIRLNQPVVGMAATPTGEGYWLVAADGGIFSFGDAGFFGTLGFGSTSVIGMAPSPTGNGYAIATPHTVVYRGDAFPRGEGSAQPPASSSVAGFVSAGAPASTLGGTVDEF